MMAAVDGVVSRKSCALIVNNPIQYAHDWRVTFSNRITESGTPTYVFIMTNLFHL